jgi:hypothetical protein
MSGHGLLNEMMHEDADVASRKVVAPNTSIQIEKQIAPASGEKVY